ncbi:MAG: hypothetical protein HC819_16325 [Cyclobacteriaceae bacterium]|nr:hypothetical protein [Cyclobacteriaceae bacterium]
MFKGFLIWIFDLYKLGVQSHDEEISRRISFSNVVFISLPVVYFSFMLIDYKSFLDLFSKPRFDQAIVPVVILICFFCLWLNHRGFSLLSRILFLTLWPFLLHIIPIALLKTPLDYYIAFPLGVIFHSLLIQLMLSHRKEAGWYWLFLGLNFLTMLIEADVLAYFVEQGVTPNEIIFDKYFLFDNILYWLLFNLVMFYVLLIIELYIKRINRAKRLIENQKEELDAINENLEKLVEERTHNLEEKNIRLRDYAFYHAHLLRAPYCRVLGLLQLMSMTSSEEEKRTDIMPKLVESLDELDMVIKKINHIVDVEV